MSYYVNELFFEEWNHEMAYVLGFWFADGNMYINEKKHIYKFHLCIHQDDVYLLELIRKSMSSEHPISQQENTKRLEIGSKALIQSLQKHGGHPNKSNTIKFPNVPANFLPDFIRGFFDGDGTVLKDKAGKTWKAEMFSNSEDFINKLHQELLNSIDGLFCSTSERNKLHILKFSANNARRLAKFIYATPSLLFLFRKRNRFLEMGPEISKAGKKIREHRHCLSFMTEGYLLQRVQSGESIRSIARSLNVDKGAILYHCKKYGIDYKNRPVTIERQRGRSV